MSHNPIFLPMGVLAFWTMAVLLLIPVQRIRAAASARVSAEDFKFGESENVPGDVRIPNRAIMNLLEMPVLFYVVCLMFVITDGVDAAVLELAWVYVGFRLAHTLIHLTYNKVIHRTTMFAISNFVLVSLWGIFFLR